MDKEQISSMMNLVGDTYGTHGGGGFNWPNLIAGLIFGTIGLVAFMYGKKERAWKPLAIGIVLMVYPYFVPNTILSYAIGITLTAALYFWRD